MSKSVLLRISCCFVSMSILTLAVREDETFAGTVKCLFAETAPGQGAIQAEANGSFVDENVWDVYASSAACFSSSVKVDILSIDNINTVASSTTPSSFAICYASGVYETVINGYRSVRVDGELTDDEDDGIMDADIYADESGGLSIDPDDLTDVDVLSGL